MHDEFQIGTLAVILFGIMLSRYDFNTIRKEMREESNSLRGEINGLRREMREENAVLRKELREEITNIRASLERQTTTINTMIFGHTERLAKIETKLGGKP